MKKSHDEMEFTLELKDFTDPIEAEFYCVMGEAELRFNESLVDADICPGVPEMFPSQCDILTVSLTARGRDYNVLPQLTAACRKRIKQAYFTWTIDREEACSDDSYSWVDAKMDEWKERRRG